MAYVDMRALYAPPTWVFFDLSNNASAFSPQTTAIFVPQRQLSLSSIYKLHVQMVRWHRTNLKVAKLYRVMINKIDYTKTGMSDNSSTWDSHRWCCPVTGESQHFFIRKETEIFPEIITSESDIFTFWSSVSTILDDSLWDLNIM